MPFCGYRRSDRRTRDEGAGRALLKISPCEMPEPNVHSFIVKLWLEEDVSRKGMDGWHGQITHVPSGERRYLKDLQDIVTFIKPYIDETDATWVEQLRRWLKSTRVEI